MCLTCFSISPVPSQDIPLYSFHARQKELPHPLPREKIVQARARTSHNRPRIYSTARLLLITRTPASLPMKETARFARGRTRPCPHTFLGEPQPRCARLPPPPFSTGDSARAPSPVGTSPRDGGLPRCGRRDLNPQHVMTAAGYDVRQGT